MAVYDRWHRTGPGEPCREHGLVPSAAHGSGLRWQVRWYNDEGVQCKKSFRLKNGRNPDVHAEAFDAQVGTDPGADPGRGDVTFREYAEDWRKARTVDPVTAERIEQRLRIHAYPVIGARKMRDLSRRPSLTQAWISGMTCAPGTARMVVGDVSAVFDAAADDGIVTRNPTRAKSVTRPVRPRARARAWTLARVEAVAAALAGRHAVIPYLGAGTGMRQGEIFGLGADDVAFLGRSPLVHVRRQVKLVGNVPHFAPVKNRREHSVPLAPSLAVRLARHLELYPPAQVTLPWHDPRDRARHGRPVTVRLVLADARGGPLNRRVFGDGSWRPALERAGVVPARGPGRRRPPASPQDGMHVLRHTAASAWLRAGVDIARVADWLGDTVKVTLETYVHFLPGGDDDGRAAVDAFFTPAPDAPDVPSRDAR